MKIRIMAAGAAAVLSMVVVAPQAAAEPEPDADDTAATEVAAAPEDAEAAPTEWVMPDLAEMSLAKAQRTFAEATEGSDLTLFVLDSDAQPTEVLSAPNWTVCSQGPDAGTTITKESWTGVAIDRWNQCWT